MSEYDTRQMSVILVRMEKKLDQLEQNLVSRVELEALREDVRKLENTTTWLYRTAGSALVIAILDPLFRVLGS